MVRQIHLDQTLKEIVGASKLRPVDYTDREQVIKNLNGVVTRSLSLRGSSVEAYGSFVSELSTRWGDLDMSINLYNRYNKFNNDPLVIVRNNLSEQDGWQDIEYFDNAKVPILKMYHQLGNNKISCDVSLNNWSALVKSKLLRLISNMDMRFHDMVLLVKEWAQSKDINDPKPGKGTFNSYSLTLLVIYHFQTCEPPILPPLEHIYSKSVNHVLNESGVSKNVTMQKIVEECAKNIATWSSSNRLRQINNSSLSDLFISFMEEFSSLFEGTEVERICTSKAERSPDEDDTKDQLYVVDPFEINPSKRTNNVARTVSWESRRKICEAFKSTHDILTKSTRQLSPERLFEELSEHVSPTIIISKSPHTSCSQWVPQQLPRYTMIDSTYKTKYTEARLLQQDYGFKDTYKRAEKYLDEEEEEEADQSSSSQKQSSSRSGLGWAMLGIGSLALAGTALYSMSRDPPTKNDDDDSNNKANQKNTRRYY